MLLCVLGLGLLYRLRPAAAFRELGTGASPLHAAAFSLLATSPMLLVYGWAAGFGTALSLRGAITTAVMAPLAEEVLYRGFLFGQLRRRAGWSFWGAAMVGLVPFALGHLYQAVQAEYSPVDTAGVLAVTGAGHVFFAWLLERWGSLWVPMGMHALMNLWWGLFAVDTTALGGAQANLARGLTLALAIGFTVLLRRGRPGWAEAPPPPGAAPALSAAGGS
ncbi:CPBP family intramembrane glutamic endopeptidase [Myxococcus sp. Y35]|uniref:CPBP family intramembrane glutamic endopeptidase n=1 Tax=Pseudomyxococcus flavus TaxID=3115648 RepID=UPI003CE9737D